MTFTSNMFNEIKDSLSKKGDSSYKDIMKFEPGKTYVVRLVPNVHEPKKTIYHYYHHSWNSLANGQFVTALCPSTYGETCPIDSYVLKTYNTGTQEDKESIRPITRKENWMVNAYVITDPTNPDNEGKVKVIRYGKELAKIIDSAINGDDSDEFGVKIFDVLNGCSFKIKCESRSANIGNRMMTTYTSSKFTSPSKIDVDAEAIHEAIFDLEKFNKPKTTAELQRMLDQHHFCVQDLDTKEEIDEDTVPAKPALSTKKDDALKEIFSGIKEETAKNETPKKETPKAQVDDTDAKLKELLAGL